ncbi:hypothetical protein [Pseudomonas mandelii]|uniref:hypothetical protein n=1 Tax=Pseudomonas mandelii TaxID=75612 RepID=UPI003C743856
MTRPASTSFNNSAPLPSGRTSPGASAAQLIDHHENWIRDTFLWLPLKAKDAALSAAWAALGTRKRIPTWHDWLDALRVAALHEQDRFRIIHDDVPTTPDDEE